MCVLAQASGLSEIVTGMAEQVKRRPLTGNFNSLFVNSNVVELDFARDMQPLGVSLAREGEALLANAIVSMEGLQKLDLSGSGTKHIGTARVAEALASNNSMLHLSLSFCKISDFGASALASALRINNCLLSLNLFGNQVADSGCTHLAESLKCNWTLRQLELGFNRIADRGATRLADAFNRNTSLSSIGLENNEIDDWGMQTLAHAIPESGLTELQVHGNPASQESQCNIASVVRKNKRRLTKSKSCLVSPQRELYDKRLEFGCSNCGVSLAIAERQQELRNATLQKAGELLQGAMTRNPSGVGPPARASARKIIAGEKKADSLPFRKFVGDTSESAQNKTLDSRVTLFSANVADSQRVVVKGTSDSACITTARGVLLASRNSVKHHQSMAGVPMNTANRASVRHAEKSIKSQARQIGPSRSAVGSQTSSIENLAGPIPRSISPSFRQSSVYGEFFSDLQSRSETAPPSQSCEDLSIISESSESLFPSLDSECLSVNSITMGDIFASTQLAYKHRIEFQGAGSHVKDDFATRAADTRLSRANESECCEDAPTDEPWSRIINLSKRRSYCSADDLEIQVIPSRSSRKKLACGSCSNSILDPNPILFDL